LKKKLFSILFALVLVLSFGLMTAVPAGAEGEVVTLIIPENVYRPAEFDATSSTTIGSGSYTNLRFNITLDGPVDFTGDRADTFTITKVDGSTDTQGVNDTFVLNDGDWVGYWGPEAGFQPPSYPYNATTTFTVQMNDVTTAPLGDYDVTVELVDLTPDPDVTLATATDSFSLSADTLYVGTTDAYQFNTIQDAIDAASADDTINVAAGTYNEQIVIDKPLTLQGAGDTTIIQPSGPGLTATTSIPWINASTGTMSAIVSVETTGDEVTIRDLKIDASLITSKATTWFAGLVYLETSGTIEGLTVIGNPPLPDRTAGIFAAAIDETTLVEVTGCDVIGYNRAGIYALGEEFTADYHHNEINGPGTLSTGVPNGMFFLEGANGSATYNTVTDLGYTGVGEYRSTGIGTYAAGANVTFAYNTISNVQNAFALSTGTIGTIVEYNTVFNNHTGVRIEAAAASSVIQYNDIHDNDFAIRCGAVMGDGNEAHFNNFCNNPGLEWTNTEEAEPNTYVGAVCNLHEVYDLDATNIYWCNASGPSHSPGEGDSVSDGVLYEPWLLEPVVPGQPLPTIFEKTLALKIGWTLVSVDNWIDPASAVGGNVTLAYNYIPGGGWSEVTPAALVPVDALYLKTVEGGGVGFDYSGGVPVASSKDLVAGWNLISSATETDAKAVLSPLRYVPVGEEQGVALTTLVSQGNYNQHTGSFYLATLGPLDWFALKATTLNPFDGYWVYMNAGKNFGVVPD